MAAYAGGYTKKFCEAILRGAEEFLKLLMQNRREVFATGAHVPEESFVEADEEVMDASPEAAVLDEKPTDDPENPENHDYHGDEFSQDHQDLQEEKKRPTDDDENQENHDYHGALSDKDAGSLQSRLQLVHRRLGHPTNETLRRILEMAGANESLLKMASELQCPTCKLREAPKRPLPARPEARPICFNSVVHADLKFQRHVKGDCFCALSVVDGATGYHVARLVGTRDSDHVGRKFLTCWVSMFGIPTQIIHDQGGEFEAGFIAVLEQHSIASKVIGAHAPWRAGLAERHGGLLGVAWSGVIQEQMVATVSRKGHSAHALVFGREAYFSRAAGRRSLECRFHGASTFDGRRSSEDGGDASGGKDFLDPLGCSRTSQVKKALRRAPGGENGQYAPGELVFFWAPDPNKARYRKDAGVWRGPAVVLLPDGESRYFLSWRGRCLLVAATNVKGASLDEAGDQELRLRGCGEGLRGPFQGVCSREDEIAPHEVQTPGVRVRKPPRMGARKMTEARRMMAGLKSIKKCCEIPWA